ncbi:hypothetical protein [Halorarum salinum]|nr:hypothetical protein [Halobaculum salinum]
METTTVRTTITAESDEQAIVEGPGVTHLLYRVDGRQGEMEYDEP